MSMTELVRIKKQHDHTHDAEWNGYHEWWSRGTRVKADSLGRPNDRMHYATWTQWECNNGDCAAWALVSDQLIQSALERAES